MTTKIQSAVVMCPCGWKREITVAEAFNDDAKRSAEQAGRGHVSSCGNGYEDVTVDVIYG